MFENLNQMRLQTIDLGEIAVAEGPRHNVPPIRNFPLSKEVWKKTETFLNEHFSIDYRGLIVGLGGDCSMVVGAVSSAAKIFDGNVHLLYLDGDVDSIAPDPEKCVGSAGMGLWFLTQKSDYWEGARLSPQQITVLGNKKTPDTDIGIPSLSLEELRTAGIHSSVRKVMTSIPETTNILVHFDVDLIADSEMPAAYAPRVEGLTLREAEDLLASIMMDKRVRYLEFSEFMPSKDLEGRYIKRLIELLARSLARDH